MPLAMATVFYVTTKCRNGYVIQNCLGVSNFCEQPQFMKITCIKIQLVCYKFPQLLLVKSEKSEILHTHNFWYN